jgi:hypothetical protein
VPGVNDVDPSAALDTADFIRLMRRLVVAAGSPSLREISQRANTAKAASLPHSTLNDVFHKETMPSWRIVDSFVRALGVSAGLQMRWRSTWERLEARDSIGVVGDTTAVASSDEHVVMTGNRQSHSNRLPPRSDQLNDAAQDCVTWLKRTLIRPNIYKGEWRVGVFEISHPSSVSPYETRQLSGAFLKPGDSIGCWLEHPLLEFQTLYHCFASGKSADRLTMEELPKLFEVSIKCLGQLRVIETDWVPFDDEDRGISYHAAYLVELTE